MSDKPKPSNMKLYNEIKQEIKDKYNKRWNAFYSGLLVQEYKKRGGTYEGEKAKGDLGRWFNEKWQDVGNKEYPVYRPTKKVNAKTPLTPDEINKKNLKEQIELKQKIKGKSNLPSFKVK